MRLLKFFSLIAVFVLAASYVKADEAPEAQFETSPSLQQEEIGLNDEPISYHSNADERTDTDTEALPPYDQGYSIEEDQMMSAYNSPARIEVTGSWDVNLRASYIYWLPKLKGMEYAVTRPADFDTNAAVDYTYKLHDVSQDYHSGFKVALGTNLSHDNWTALVEYTRLHVKNNSHTSQSTNTYVTYPERLISLWMNSTLEHNTPDTPDTDQGRFSKLTGRLKTNYDMLKLEFARPFYQGTCLTFRPHMGLIGGWIKYSFKTVGTILTSTYTTNAKSHSSSWLVGPRFGVDGHWILGAGFEMEGNVAGSLAYQDFKVNFKQRSDYYTSNYLYLVNDKDYSQITPVLEGNIGLNWGTYFAENGWHFSLHALYDFLYYFDQNYMRKLSGQILDSTVVSGDETVGLVASRSNSKPEDLLIHGLTITARLDF